VGLSVAKKDEINKTVIVISWALYDLANQFFALNIVSLYFVRWLTIDLKTPEIFYGSVFGISTLFICIASPLFGALSDRSGRYRDYLISLTLVSVFFTFALGLTRNVFWLLFFFAIANFGCQTAIISYNSLLINIAGKGRIGFISGIGRMFAYSGAILAVYLVKPLAQRYGDQATFIPTAIYFLIFALPCLLFVKDAPAPSKDKKRFTAEVLKNDFLSSLAFLKKALSGRDENKALGNFLKAAFFGLLPVNTIILFMSVYATRVFGLNSGQVVDLIVFSTLFAIAGSLLSGYLSDYFGYKRSLCAVFILWIVCFILGSQARNTGMYFLIGALVGTAMGGVWAICRAFIASTAPADKIGEIFGLFNLAGYMASILGALYWGLILLALSQLGETGYRIALLSLNIFMAMGVLFLLRLPHDSARSG